MGVWGLAVALMELASAVLFSLSLTLLMLMCRLRHCCRWRGARSKYHGWQASGVPHQQHTYHDKQQATVNTRACSMGQVLRSMYMHQVLASASVDHQSLPFCCVLQVGHAAVGGWRGCSPRNTSAAHPSVAARQARRGSRSSGDRVSERTHHNNQHSSEQRHQRWQQGPG